MPAPSPYRALQTTGLAGSHDFKYVSNIALKAFE